MASERCCSRSRSSASNRNTLKARCSSPAGTARWLRRRSARPPRPRPPRAPAPRPGPARPRTSVDVGVQVAVALGVGAHAPVVRVHEDAHLRQQLRLPRVQLVHVHLRHAGRPARGPGPDTTPRVTAGPRDRLPPPPAPAGSVPAPGRSACAPLRARPCPTRATYLRRPRSARSTPRPRPQAWGPPLQAARPTVCARATARHMLPSQSRAGRADVTVARGRAQGPDSEVRRLPVLSEPLCAERGAPRSAFKEGARRQRGGARLGPYPPFRAPQTPSSAPAHFRVLGRASSDTS